MFQKLRLKRRIDKILVNYFSEVVPTIYVEKHNLGYKIIYFRTTPKYPSAEEMKVILELGLNINLRRTNEILGVNGSSYLYLKGDTSIIVESSFKPVSEGLKVELDSVTTLDMIKSPHILLNGATGSGKSYLLSYLMICFKECGAELIVIDGKNTDIDVIGIILNKDNLAFGSEMDKILYVHNMMIDRQTIIRRKLADNPKSLIGKNFMDHNLKPIILVIDEYKSFIDSLSKVNKIKGQTESKYYENLIQDIVAKGRSLGVFVILASQRFSTDTLKNDIRSNFGVVISMGNEKKETNLMLFGTTLVPTVTGYGGLIKSNEYEDVVTFKSPYISNLEAFVSGYSDRV